MPTESRNLGSGNAAFGIRRIIDYSVGIRHICASRFSTACLRKPPPPLRLEERKGKGNFVGAYQELSRAITDIFLSAFIRQLDTFTSVVLFYSGLTQVDEPR